MQITAERLRAALAGKLGSVLTPELAAEVLCAAFDRDDHALDPSSFPPRQHAGLRFAVESFRDILPELEPLHAAHFAETERHLDGVALAPDYDYMAERERLGQLLQFTARADGKLVGNLRMYLYKSLHTGQPCAREDTFYLSQDHRKGYAAVAFVRYAKDMLAQAGVRELYASAKVVNAASRVLERVGFRHVANEMFMPLTA